MKTTQKKLRGLKIKRKYPYKPKKKLLYVGTKKQMLQLKKSKKLKENYFIKKYYSKYGLYRKHR